MSDVSILVVEDEPSVAEVVALYLRRAGYIVRMANTGPAAVHEFDTQPPSLIILDLMLPGLDGLAITRHVRERGDTPIIMLTARSQETDRIAGLEMGADDYVTKPFSPQELVSRVRAVLRRAKPSGAGEPIERALTFDDLRIDPQTRLVTIHGAEKSLTAKEFDLLWLLARHPRQVFSRDQLLERVWGMAEYIDPGTVTVHVRRLREKIEDDPSNPQHLQTAWGVGYKFEP
ncbi:MAG TPA: response regulator transcription factor [Anaerolineae bacterium]|nr:response regulator transcription factor [Anaerolineae bacterium]